MTHKKVKFILQSQNYHNGVLIYALAMSNDMPDLEQFWISMTKITISDQFLITLL